MNTAELTGITAIVAADGVPRERLIDGLRAAGLEHAVIEAAVTTPPAGCVWLTSHTVFEAVRRIAPTDVLIFTLGDDRHETNVDAPWNWPATRADELAALLVRVSKAELLRPQLVAREDECRRLERALEEQRTLLRRTLVQKGETLFRQLEALRVRAIEEARAQSRDPLTGLLNHSALRRRIHFELDRCRREDAKLGFLLLALDDFAAFNHRRGYEEGDRALRIVGQSLPSLWLVHERARPVVIGRDLGDRFAVVLPDCDHEELELRAEAVRELVERLPVGPPRITATIGGLLANRDATTEELFLVCERRLEHGKRSGGNRSSLDDAEAELPPVG